MQRVWLPLSLSSLALVFACGKNDSGGSGTDSASTSSGGNTLTTTTMTGEPTLTATTEPTSTMTTSPTSSPDSSGSDGSTTDDTDTGVPDCPYTPVDGMPAIALQQVANGFDRPLLAIGHPDQPDRLYVVEQGGAIRILEPGMTTAPADAFLQLDVACAGNQTIGCEQGMLGFAFHPDFPQDPRVYVAYSPADAPGEPPTRVSEFMLMGGDDNHADPTSERVVIEGFKPFGNHNGGMIAFGPDGYLYFGLGDGGNADDDPQATGRDKSVILSKILRIDVEPDGMPDSPVACATICDQLGPFDYTIPPDNPYVDDPALAPEIWAWGFRNPWRFSFDIDNGDLYVGDVGQDQIEEVDIVTKGNDYGWHTMEGNTCFQGSDCDDTAAPGQPNADNMIAPLVDYSHNDGCSVTGGGVYRSCEVPAWDGVYIYGDYCAGNLSALVWDGSTVNDFGEVLDVGERVIGTGWNAWGDVYVTTVDAIPNGPISDGLIYRVAPQP